MRDARAVPRANQSKPIDWTMVRRRLAEAQAATEKALAPAGEQEKQILRTRAAALAREPVIEKREESLLIVTFVVAYETYGLEVRSVREILPLRDLTPLPWVAAFMVGIVNVRGRILPVIDIKKLFDLPEKGLTDLNKVVVIQDEGRELGILADQIMGVRLIPLSSIQLSLPTLTGIREDYLRGVTGEGLVILSAEKVLADKRLNPNLQTEPKA